MEDIKKRRQERIEKLNEVGGILKAEFIGLDNIIDEILRSVAPWYITPEVIKRPTIVSLWGMTGTGKTSVIKRLIELLEVDKKSVYFDCGAEADSTNRNTDIVDNICRSIGLEPEDLTPGITDAEDIVIIFDEFQYTKTLDEHGEELIKSNLRSIWKLLDDGIVELNDSTDWEFQKFIEFVEDLEPFAKNNPSLKVENGYIIEERDVKLLMDEVGYYLYPYRSNPTYESGESEGPTRGYCEYGPDEREDGEEEKNPYRPLKILNIQNVKAIVKKLAKSQQIPTEKMVELSKITTLGDYVAYLKTITRLSKTKSKRTLSCNKSLIFIIGNLDEAFHSSDEMSPDIDADIFRDITSKVSVSDIKTALLKRFRPEQVARIGNNLIKYPTLGKEDFEKIIHKEVSRILEDFKKVDDITVKVKPEIYELLYHEGVYPTQGVRPIFTTIGTILTPFLSKIVLDRVGDEVEIGLKDPNDCAVRVFKIPKTTITLKFGDEKTTEYPIALQLGALRDPKNCKTRYGNAVHEAGHAVVFSLLTGEAPTNIVAVSADGGGFCSTYLPDKEKEIRTSRDVENEVMIALAGYEAEELMFPNPSMRLMGSSSDLEDAWTMLADNAMNSGYFGPYPYASKYTEQSPAGWFSGFDSDRIEPLIRERWTELREKTKLLLKKEERLIKELGKWLGEYGSIKQDNYLALVEKYGTTLSSDYMKNIRKEYSPEYYLRQLGD